MCKLTLEEFKASTVPLLGQIGVEVVEYFYNRYLDGYLYGRGYNAFGELLIPAEERKRVRLIQEAIDL